MRRRLWRRKGRSGLMERSHSSVGKIDENGASAGAAADAAPSSATVTEAYHNEEGEGATITARIDRRAPAQDEAARSKALKRFLAMVFGLLERRKWWTLAPDPAGLYTVYQRHQRLYATLQVQAYERRLFTTEDEAPASVLHPAGGRTLLQDMLCAAMHARAAYGYAMAAGHIASVGSYIKHKAFAPFSFDAVAGVSAEANVEAVAEMTGIEPADVLQAEWTNSTFRPCHYLAVDRANRCLVLSVRGSLEVGDVLSDLTADPMEVTVNGTSGWVHEGIFSAATYIHCTTAHALEKAAQRFAGWPLLLTGHSLGGGVAALVATLIRQSRATPGLGAVRCLTLGPAAVMSEALAQACADSVTSIILASDVVPKLSYASVEGLITELSDASPLQTAARGITQTISSVLGLGEEKKAQPWHAVREAAQEGARPEALMDILEDRGAQDAAAQVTRRTLRGASPGRTIPVLDEAALSDWDESDRDDAASPEKKLRGDESKAAAPRAPKVLMPYAGDVLDAPMLPATAALDAVVEDKTKKGLPKDHHGGPEHLFPPGRLIWLFPADEDKSSNNDKGSVDQAGGDAASKSATPTPAAKEEVSVQEAEKVVDRGQDPSAGDVAQAAKQSGDARAKQGRPVPVAAEVDRASFEKILLVPECFNDHLPDRYLQVLQEL